MGAADTSVVGYSSAWQVLAGGRRVRFRSARVRGGQAAVPAQDGARG